MLRARHPKEVAGSLYAAELNYLTGWEVAGG
jgi:hypothetical protein